MIDPRTSFVAPRPSLAPLRSARFQGGGGAPRVRSEGLPQRPLVLLEQGRPRNYEGSPSSTGFLIGFLGFLPGFLPGFIRFCFGFDFDLDSDFDLISI